jgi:HrpA-like RNA helicase
MAALRLGDIENFGFLDPADRCSIGDGVQLLQLGAFDAHGAITHRKRLRAIDAMAVNVLASQRLVTKDGPDISVQQPNSRISTV